MDSPGRFRLLPLRFLAPLILMWGDQHYRADLAAGPRHRDVVLCRVPGNAVRCYRKTPLCAGGCCPVIPSGLRWLISDSPLSNCASICGSIPGPMPMIAHSKSYKACWHFRRAVFLGKASDRDRQPIFRWFTPTLYSRRLARNGDHRHTGRYGMSGAVGDTWDADRSAVTGPTVFGRFWRRGLVLRWQCKAC